MSRPPRTSELLTFRASRIQNIALRHCVIVAVYPIMAAINIPLALLAALLWFCWAQIRLVKSICKVWN